MEKLSRLDSDPELRKKLLPHCRLEPGEIWTDPLNRHKVGLGDATDSAFLSRLFGNSRIGLLLNDPPYNISVGQRNTNALSRSPVDDYVEFSRKWISAALLFLAENSHFYLWTGADQRNGFQPLPELMLLLREFPELKSRSFITMRNQRGYGTQSNWMSVRQELLYYTRGNPDFTVTYTDIPKILKGYYKTVAGERTENSQRSRSDFIRPGNVWVDIQQVFYRMKENVPGTYAQKPLKSAERIIRTSPPAKGTVIADLFSHSGTTLVAAEKMGFRCNTMDIDPVFAEISIRRLEQFRNTGNPGWQMESPFPEL